MSEAGTVSDDNILSQLVGTIRASSAISAQDVEFFKSLDPSIAGSLNQTSSTLLNMINDVILSVDENNDTIEHGDEGLQSSWKNIGEVMDLLFEKSEHALSSLNRKNTAPTGNTLQYLDDSTNVGDNVPRKIQKPQINFLRAVDNSESRPFQPLLKTKPHALKALDEALILTTEEENVPAHYPQPYEYEIDNQEYDESVLQIRPPLPSASWENCEATWVDNEESLNQMFAALLQAKELAIDLEHHDYRSYYGITCLMQISTREQDWLVDTIALRDNLWILNEVFTNPKIIKVLHGAFMDIIWLQRDLGLYIVGLFDTYHASRLLGFPKHSLAYLLERYAHFKTSKKYQLSDWRVRPLPKALKAYARADTHFLLNIYDQLRNALVEQSKLAQVLHNSRNVAKRRFEYTTFRPKVTSSTVFSPVEREDPWRSLMFQYNIPPERSLLVKKLYEWRDLVAKREDESPRFVAPNQLLVSLVMSAPTEPSSVLAVGTFLTDHVRTNAKALAQLIKRTLSTSNDELIGMTSAVEDKKLQKLSVNEIERNLAYFTNFIDHFTCGDLQESRLEKESALFEGKPLPAESYVTYQKSQTEIVSSRELENRELQISSSSDTLGTTDLVEIPVQNTEDESKPVSNSATKQIESSVDPIEPSKESKDEVIVLKEKRRVPKESSSAKGEESSPKEILDFKTAKKVLSTSNNTFPKGNKKRFDPYAAEHNGPEGVKRRKKTKGMQKSFKG
ncbi:LANO_0A06568g1_1 [Lachancea nothofagi CBS 11611]|uniref:LANO_0A06568g1_1 n=1 Tax=Lachancea nothofagi CBS 11611 TaxID=1266666 RepID=A0A1G4IRW4_9SACH|nr:LANO_0A06568g1_1 [Lachancea nothofagi CBS 11611]